MILAGLRSTAFAGPKDADRAHAEQGIFVPCSVRHVLYISWQTSRAAGSQERLLFLSFRSRPASLLSRDPNGLQTSPGLAPPARGALAYGRGLLLQRPAAAASTTSLAAPPLPTPVVICSYFRRPPVLACRRAPHNNRHRTAHSQKHSAAAFCTGLHRPAGHARPSRTKGCEHRPSGALPHRRFQCGSSR